MAEAKAADAARTPSIEWDSGTAYDFFASFWVLQQPEEFGLRASWAAGVRSRLPEESRRFMAEALHFAGVPLGWIRGLPAPKDSRAAIQELERLSPREVTETVLLQCFEDNPKAKEASLRVVRRGRWEAQDAEDICCGGVRGMQASNREAERKRLEAWLDTLCRPEDAGSAFRRGMDEYRESFFREEERRIAPALDRALAAAKERAAVLPPADLLEELTQGLRLGHLLNRPRLWLVPCYWCSPRIIYGDVGTDVWIVLFGARPPDASLVPEDQVPAPLSLALTALADNTRLNILRLLRGEPLTQAEIARRLRLRPSTISHHIKSLRIAGLITYIESGESDLRYEARVPRIREVCAGIGDFLEL